MSTEYTFGSTDGVAAVIETIGAMREHPWRLTLFPDDIDAVRACLTEAGASRCPERCAGCTQGCWRSKAAASAGRLPAAHTPVWDWVLQPDDLGAVLRALIFGWDHECPQHQSGCPHDCWRFTAAELAGVIAETAGVAWI